MDVLVTGGAGFIGSALISELSAAGGRHAFLRYANVCSPGGEMPGEAGEATTCRRAMQAGEAPAIHGDGRARGGRLRSGGSVEPASAAGPRSAARRSAGRDRTG